MKTGRRRKLHFSKIYSFRCGRSSFEDDHSQIGGPGFSRVVHCNDPGSFEAAIHNNVGNYVRSTKYTAASFFPKALFEQFRRVANFYFLVVGTLAFTPLAPYSSVSAIIPLVVIVAGTMVKEGMEDWQRKRQDIEVNNRKVKVHRGNGDFEYTEWKNLRVADIVKVEKDEFFPADLLLLSSKQQHPLSPQQLLLRDSKLRNTDHIYGAVIFTGYDTKVVQNSTDPPSKRSKIERKMDKIIYFLFGVLFTIAFIGSIYFGITTSDDLKDSTMKRWYLRPDKSTIFFDPKRAPAAAIYHFLTAVMLYSYLIPISLRADQPAHARTSNLTEELGQVDTILSDKTGTLTCNSMEFIKCSVAGTAYGCAVTEVEKDVARRKGSPLPNEMVNGKDHVKGFNFEDKRIINGNWVNEPHSIVIQKFLRLLAICHTAIPEVDEDTGKVSYEAESPDEAAFVIAARELGFEFYKRTQASVSLHELNPLSGKKVERLYNLLNVLEFNSSRKRMSVIVRDEDGKLLLFCKGLRTLILAYRELDEEEYKEFNERFAEARNSVSADREALIDDVTEKIEKDLTLLGATAVEDKLQNGVPECIDKLASAGIKIWVLTGDKMETAINIGFACSLLRQGMKQIIINLETPEIKALEKAGEKDVIAKASKESVFRQISEGKAQLTASKGIKSFALIIDGKSLVYALEGDMKKLFLELAVGCASVICCRSSPKQKALVTRLVKAGTGKTTLAIGDGANDVGMLQEADIGVGISGVEGMQAVMSSDIAIAQFRFLERLLLVHGHWCYRRISSMICYFFYKNITFGATVFLYEAHASFSGQPAYNDWFLSFYNIFFSSFPVVALGVFDQDVSARLCLKFPLLYQEGVQNILFSWRRILGWMFNGLCSAVIIFFFCTKALDPQAFNSSGKIAGFQIVGATMYTCVVWVVNCQMALAVGYFTLVQHLVVWGSIAFWYLFLLGFGYMPTSVSATAYKVLIECLAPAPSFWLVILFAVISALIPYYSYSAIQMRFFPMYHEKIRWIGLEGRSNDSENCNMVRQRSIELTSVGSTARRG
ncbi:ATPase E1-E2 type family protein [Actinidia rufa]|uniref:Phospholipid-transporting ATPase n=1 Tax=Actinidia rufa TaxID=165716 RepID=A0A7J0HE23_9ERIC|nr:ATPase E1-E2 type family protein [Actinidia rufa]